jgi:hypothetical protein
LEVQRLNDQRRLVAKANDKSDRIIAQLRRQKLGEIFERMDGDRDGEISHSKIDDVLSLELRNAFRPLLGELEQLQQPLDKEEFIDAGMRLYNTLSQREKNLILKFETKGIQPGSELDKCTFVPKTNFSNAAARVKSGNLRSPSSR